MDKNLDLFEYITILDIGDGTSNEAPRAKSQALVPVSNQEESKQAAFDFANFAAGGDGNPNNQENPSGN